MAHTHAGRVLRTYMRARAHAATLPPSTPGLRAQACAASQEGGWTRGRVARVAHLRFTAQPALTHNLRLRLMLRIT